MSFVNFHILREFIHILSFFYNNETKYAKYRILEVIYKEIMAKIQYYDDV